MTHRGSDEFRAEQDAKREAQGATIVALNDLRVEQEQAPAANGADSSSPHEHELDEIRRRIAAGHDRAECGEREWIEGALDMGAAYFDARKQFKSDIEFGDFLKRSGLNNRLGKNDRAALIHLGSNIAEARKVLEATESRSYRQIWDAVKDKGRFPSAGKPRNQKREDYAQAEAVEAQRLELEEQQLRNVELNGNLMPPEAPVLDNGPPNQPVPPQPAEPPESAKPSRAMKRSISDIWNTGSEAERECIKALAIEEFFANATGSEIFGRIKPGRLIGTMRVMLDLIGADRVMEEMTSEEFKRDLRARMPAPKKGNKNDKPYKTINLTASKVSGNDAGETKHS